MTAPRRATPRRPDLYPHTAGPYAVSVLRGLGITPHPWQPAALDVALELDPRTGWPAHSLVVWLVPRRAGKSVAVSGAMLWRAAAQVGAHVFYTAQKGTIASQWFRDELLPPLTRASVFAGRYTSRMSQGREEVAWRHSGGFVRVFAPTAEGLHSTASDMVVLDEAWAHDGVRGAELLQAIGPTQATRPGAQRWVVSAAGTAESGFLIDQLAAARAAHADNDPSVALLEFGVPDDEDPTDVATVARHHPAVGITIDPAYLRTERVQLGPDGFARAYGCWQPMAGGTSGRISTKRWADLADSEPSPAGADFTIAVEVTDTRDTAVVAAWLHPDGRVGLEVLRAAPGTGWAVEWIDQLLRTRRPRPRLAVNDAGLARDLADVLTGRGHHIDRLTGSRYAAACAWFAEQANTGRLTHRGQWELDDTIPVAGTRPLGEGWAWSQRRSDAPIATLGAATVAAYVHYHKPRTKAVVRSA